MKASELRYRRLFETAQDAILILDGDTGKIIEFEEPRIEALQEEIARRYGFQVTSHKHEMYGTCADCQKKAKRSAQVA